MTPCIRNKLYWRPWPAFCVIVGHVSHAQYMYHYNVMHEKLAILRTTSSKMMAHAKISVSVPGIMARIEGFKKVLARGYLRKYDTLRVTLDENLPILRHNHWCISHNKSEERNESIPLSKKTISGTWNLAYSQSSRFSYQIYQNNKGFRGQKKASIYLLQLKYS